MLRLRHLTLLASVTSLTLAATACDPGPIVIEDEELADDEDTEGDPESDPEPDPEPEPEPEPGPEPCSQPNAMRACDDGLGTQFCSGSSWGPCLEDFDCMPGEVTACGVFDDGNDIYMDCFLAGGVPRWNYEACNTPLVLSFDAAPVEMVTSSAAFDISGVGACYDTDWPAARTPWLAVDLDKNGFIDGGHELFGSGSILDTGRHAQNGFLALQAFDSNGDGEVSALDARYDELLVWRDEDADKQSLPHELTPLADEGVHSISLGYSVAERCDERGNCGRERASFEFVTADGHAATGEVVDVYLACQ